LRSARDRSSPERRMTSMYQSFLMITSSVAPSCCRVQLCGFVQSPIPMAMTRSLFPVPCRRCRHWSIPRTSRLLPCVVWYCVGCVKDSAPHCYHCGVWIICFRINVNVANETEVAKKAAGKSLTWRLHGACRLHAPLTRCNTPLFLSFRCGYRESRRSDL